MQHLFIFHTLHSSGKRASEVDSLFLAVNLTISSESQWKDVSKNILSVRKHSQLFTHASNTFLFKNRPLEPLGQWGKQPPNPPSWGTWTPHNTSVCGPNPPATPNDSSIGSRTSAQLPCHDAVGYNWAPQIHPQNCPLPFDDSHLYLIHPFSTDPNYHSKRHPDPFSRFTTVHFPDRQTDRWARRQVRNKSAYAQTATR